MNTPFQIKSSDKQKPVLLAYLKNFPITEKLLSLISKELRIVCISKNRIVKSKDIWYIKEDISKLQKEKIQINYLLLYIDKTSNKKFIKDILHAIQSSDIKVILVVNIREWENYKDIIKTVDVLANSKIVFQGDIFGQTVSSKISPVSTLLKNIAFSKRIMITDNELFPIFPISDHDLLIALTSIIFNNDDKLKMRYLFYQHPLTYISATHLLKRIEPDLEIDIKDKKRKIRSPRLFQSIDNDLKKAFNKPIEFFTTNISGFEKSVEYLMTKKTVNFSVLNTHKYRELKIKKLKKRTILFIGASFGTVFLYFLSAYLLFFTSLVLLKQSITALDNNDLQKAYNLSSLSNNIFTFTDFPIRITLPILPGTAENNKNYYLFIKQTAYLASLSAKSLMIFEETPGLKNTKVISQEINDLQYVYMETLKIKTDNPTADQKVITILLRKPREILQQK